MSYIVYCHTSPSGKRYVGTTSTSLSHRFQDGLGYRKNPLFWEDICKYGWDAFTHEVLFSDLDREAALDIEYRLIHEWNLLDSNYGYNLWDGKGGRSKDSAERVSESRRGNQRCLGRVLSPKTKEAISKSLKKYYQTHSGTFLGKKHSQATIELLKQRTISDESRRLMSQNHADISGSKNPSARAVRQLTKDGELIAEYPYAKAAAEQYGIDLSSIIKCCRGKIKSAGGFVWQYADSN